MTMQQTEQNTNTYTRIKMSLIAQIKSAQLAARKARDSFTALSLTTLIGEAEMIGKNASREVTDAEVVAVVKKFIKNIDETTMALSREQPLTQATKVRIVELGFEREGYDQFLPSQMNEQQLTEAVTAIKVELNAGQKDMGKVMGLLKARHEGTYDGKMASSVVKAVLA